MLNETDQIKWQPGASLSMLTARAYTFGLIRRYFFLSNVMEVDPPVIGECTVTDPYIESITVESVNRLCKKSTRFLQTSPEFFMKRMLAAGLPDIYYLGKAFRKEENGGRHNSEFTMLEWYKKKYDDNELISDVFDLVQFVVSGLYENKMLKQQAKGIEFTKESYAGVFFKYLNINPHTVPMSIIENLITKNIDFKFDAMDRQTGLDLLFSYCIEPKLDGFVCVYDYPESHAALARTAVNQDGVCVAKRFEFFLNGLELANGYWESTDPKELRQRFIKDNKLREQAGAAKVSLDEKFLAAMKSGLPECAGVALGVDRLLMGLFGKEGIKNVMPFSFA